MTSLPLILASESPRRLEILNYFKLPFEKVPHTFDERAIPWEGSAHAYAQQLSTEKAMNVAGRFPSRTVLAADTIVVIDGELLTKPKDIGDAIQMLHRLAGNWHEVITSIALFSYDGKIQTRSDETRVLMQPLTNQQIEAYLRLNVWSDKVGGYAIQGAGSILIQRIEGCYYNVIGLPIVPLTSMLADIGIDLWQYLTR
jgi:septum formation protein